ncbi:hypothetical protein CYLTODRAFT_277676 [Cylindrobasidium torrendii FP15055 ss-10]|uniref:Uncharacterized protein n=1 Tax=Cylindrobasidium torrendii FP15055 ss-10 TaxID=1314674 RepID=A0A0D7BCC0_9AGAR|nr:hypothetical protein CYLTODRAFT_277676 [Cylindrobasidium torrendii FP15055 ss-10]
MHVPAQRLKRSWAHRWDVECFQLHLPGGIPSGPISSVRSGCLGLRVLISGEPNAYAASRTLLMVYGAGSWEWFKHFSRGIYAEDHVCVAWLCRLCPITRCPVDRRALWIILTFCPNTERPLAPIQCFARHSQHDATRSEGSGGGLVPMCAKRSRRRRFCVRPFVAGDTFTLD